MILFQERFQGTPESFPQELEFYSLINSVEHAQGAEANAQGEAMQALN
jgi:hypothetical protein